MIGWGGGGRADMCVDGETMGVVKQAVTERKRERVKTIRKRGGGGGTV